MAIRLKSHWHNEDQPRSMAEIAGAIAFSAWRIALDRAITLHGENFVYQDDRQRLAVIAEYLYYQIQLADRLVHGSLAEEERRELITALALRLADHFEENSVELLGTSDEDYRGAFVQRLNERSGDYAPLGFTDDGPSYPFMRHLGYEIQQLMGAEQENRWVIDQVMDIDAPDIYKTIVRLLRNLLG